MDFVSDMQKNAATAEGEFNAQKAQIQQEAEMGETAAAVAAKLPVSPETVIEGFMMWRQIQQVIKDYALPVALLGVSLAASAVAYRVYNQKEKQA